MACLSELTIYYEERTIGKQRNMMAETGDKHSSED